MLRRSRGGRTEVLGGQEAGKCGTTSFEETKWFAWWFRRADIAMGHKIVAVSTGQSGGLFACRESSTAQPTPRARRGDPGGHGGFTYMVMYSVRAQSSRYIGLSQSSDTMPHCTAKCSFPPCHRRAVSLGSHLFLLPFFSPLSPAAI